MKLLTVTCSMKPFARILTPLVDPQPTRTQIPSSHSPSPMKMKTSVRAHTVAVLDLEDPLPATSPLRSQSAQCLNSSPVPLPPLISSPRKASSLPVAKEVTKALQDSIMNLFPADKKGKRRFEDQDEEEDREKKRLKNRPKVGVLVSGRKEN